MKSLILNVGVPQRMPPRGLPNLSTPKAWMAQPTSVE